MGAQKYTIEDVKKLLENTIYTMDESTFTYLSCGFTVITNDGYKAIMGKNYFEHNSPPDLFNVHNPYTIENIKNYIRINNITTKLLSAEYHGNSKHLEWECECGEQFSRSWNGFLQGATLCSNCSKRIAGLARRTDIDIITNKLSEIGLILLSDPNDIISNVKITAIDVDGYLYDFYWPDVKYNKFPKKFHPNNKYSIENINRFLELERNSEYKCVSNEYKGNDVLLLFTHVSCGHIFESNLVSMQGKNIGNTSEKYYKQCPKCSALKTESIHASVLKQVFLHEYLDTITEEKSCINPKTNYPLPTDIVNHRLKIAIEIQSSRHDTEKQKEVDRFKKEFWLNRGYNFYDPDIRDYTILELVQLFFPKIEEVPDYVDYNYADCIDANKVQELLNEGYSFKEIANVMNKKHGSVQALSHQKKVVIPKNYDIKILNRRPIIRLTKQGIYVKCYKNLSSITKDNMAIGTVTRVLKGKQKFAYDSFWVYEQDYLIGNYVLPEEDFDHFLLPVDKYDMNDNYICSYNSIYEAENDSLCTRSDIYRVARGKSKSSHKEKWKFKVV